jgi:hypothetical protein
MADEGRRGRDIDALVLRETRSIGNWSRALGIVLFAQLGLVTLSGVIGLIVSPQKVASYFYFPLSMIISAAAGFLLYRGGRALASFGRLGNADRAGFGNGISDLTSFFRLIRWILSLITLGLGIALFWVFTR